MPWRVHRCRLLLLPVLVCLPPARQRRPPLQRSAPHRDSDGMFQRRLGQLPPPRRRHPLPHPQQRMQLMLSRKRNNLRVHCSEVSLEHLVADDAVRIKLLLLSVLLSHPLPHRLHEVYHLPLWLQLKQTTRRVSSHQPTPMRPHLPLLHQHNLKLTYCWTLSYPRRALRLRCHPQPPSLHPRSHRPPSLLPCQPHRWIC